jgi:hypothetical protein
MLAPAVHVKCAHRVFRGKLGCLSGTKFGVDKCLLERSEGDACQRPRMLAHVTA